MKSDAFAVVVVVAIFGIVVKLPFVDRYNEPFWLSNRGMLLYMHDVSDTSNNESVILVVYV